MISIMLIDVVQDLAVLGRCHPSHLQQHDPGQEGAQQNLSVWLGRQYRHRP